MFVLVLTLLSFHIPTDSKIQIHTNFSLSVSVAGPIPPSRRPTRHTPNEMSPGSRETCLQPSRVASRLVEPSHYYVPCPKAINLEIISLLASRSIGLIGSFDDKTIVVIKIP